MLLKPYKFCNPGIDFSSIFVNQAEAQVGLNGNLSTSYSAEVDTNISLLIIESIRIDFHLPSCLKVLGFNCETLDFKYSPVFIFVLSVIFSTLTMCTCFEFGSLVIKAQLVEGQE